MDLLDDDRLLDLRPRARRTDAAAVIGEERSRAEPVPEANEALRQWPGAPVEPTPAKPTDPTALCAVCGAKPARATCPACQQGVCVADLWSMLGLCKRCAAKARA
jgi:hypothetical protein